MDLKVNIDQELWSVIEKNYKSESYSSAILDSMFFLTETIKDKTKIDADGASLVGQAFGGDSPKIKLNKLRTESEKNIQKGTQDILRGLYRAIRNPRSHEKYKDTKEDADQIICFINYILDKINKSKLSFEVSVFLERLFDNHFPRASKYSKLLIEEIPKRQRINVVEAIILDKYRCNQYIRNLGIFITELYKLLSDEEISQTYKLISNELKTTSLDLDIRVLLHVFPAKYWCRIDDAVRMRIENILKNNVQLGRHNYKEDKLISGALGTWITEEHLKLFMNPSEWTQLVLRKIQYWDPEENSYADKYFWKKIYSLNSSKIDNMLKKYFLKGMEDNCEDVLVRLRWIILGDKDHPWRSEFKEELKEYPDEKLDQLPDIEYGDGLPF